MGKITMAYKCNANKLIDYKETLNQETCSSILNKLIEESANPTCSCEQITNIFYEYIKHAIDENFRRKKKILQKFPREKWFDDECKIAK